MALKKPLESAPKNPDQPTKFDLSTLKIPSKNNSKPKIVKPKAGFTCQFCSTDFKSEKTSVTHTCKNKMRWDDRNKPTNRQALIIYQYIIKRTSQLGKKDITHEDFVKSSLYLAVMKFSEYCIKQNTIKTTMFVDYLITEKVRIDNWCTPVHYERYVRWLNEKETPDAAIERNFLLMESWALESGNAWTDFFRKINPSLAVLWIQSGRISPWVIFAAPSSVELLSRFSDEQLNLINEFIDPSIWSKKLADKADDLIAIKEVLTQSGL